MTTQSSPQATNIVWHSSVVTRQHREERNGHKGSILWFTGLSGSGKSTLAHALEDQLYQRGYHTYVLDGDNIRHGLCSDLGFSAEARAENIRRVGEMAKLFMDAGVITITAFISPFRSDRDRVRSIVSPGDFIEIYASCPLSVCESRDPKGLYRKAREGKIPEFTGISSPYEEPLNAEIVTNTGNHNISECVDQIIDELIKRTIIPKI